MEGGNLDTISAAKLGHRRLGTSAYAQLTRVLTSFVGPTQVCPDSMQASWLCLMISNLGIRKLSISLLCYACHRSIRMLS